MGQGIYGRAKVTETFTTAAACDRFDAMTVHFPARCAGRSGNRKRQTVLAPLALQEPPLLMRFVESRTLKIAPYHVSMRTPTSAAACTPAAA